MAIFRRGYAVLFAENLREVAHVMVANTFGHVSKLELGIQQQLLRLLQTQVNNVLLEALTRLLLKKLDTVDRV